MEDIKFESSIMERFILAYLIKDKSFFLKVGIYFHSLSTKKKLSGAFNKSSSQKQTLSP